MLDFSWYRACQRSRPNTESAPQLAPRRDFEIRDTDEQTEAGPLSMAEVMIELAAPRGNREELHQGAFRHLDPSWPSFAVPRVLLVTA